MPTNKREYKGKNIDEAIALACNDLKASREELDIEVLEAGSAGIFGLCKKKAVILARRKETRQGRPEPTPQEDLPASKTRHHAKPSKVQSKPKVSPKRETAVQKADEFPATPPGPEVIAAIQELLETLLRLMDIPSTVTMSSQGNKLFAHILSENNSDDIIGRDGSTLDAIQYLLRKIVSQKFPEKINLNLDAGTYREDRQKELEELALEMASKVKETGKSQVISALNPAERRIVHVTLQDDTGIRSSSIGEGLFKKVRIYLPGQGRKKTSGRSRNKSREAEEPTAADS